MNKSVQKQLEIMMKCEDLLTEALTDEKKQCFLDYVDAWHEVNSESNLNSFIMGFRLGAGFELGPCLRLKLIGAGDV